MVASAYQLQVVELSQRKNKKRSESPSGCWYIDYLFIPVMDFTGAGGGFKRTNDNEGAKSNCHRRRPALNRVPRKGENYPASLGSVSFFRDFA
jgi:hypothetical protein